MALRKMEKSLLGVPNNKLSKAQRQRKSVILAAQQELELELMNK